MIRWVAWLALGGALGALARVYVSQGTQAAFGHRFPWGTLMVNALGCALMGFLQGFLDTGRAGPVMRVFLMAGVCGGFTTFSTFAAETLRLVRTDHGTTAAVYVAASVGLGLGLFWAAETLSRRM